jgi:hypothetical protein
MTAGTRQQGCSGMQHGSLVNKRQQMSRGWSYWQLGESMFKANERRDTALHCWHHTVLMLLNASDAVWFASANSLSASELKPTMKTACEINKKHATQVLLRCKAPQHYMSGS